MEDAHIANLDIGDGVSIFGVFDGHGGKLITFYHYANRT
jgi:serine/threonine protein phosphatase PrpC